MNGRLRNTSEKKNLMNTKFLTALVVFFMGTTLDASEANAGVYTFTDLNPLPGWDNSRAYGINNVGEVREVGSGAR